MLGSSALEFAISLVFIYLMMSLAVTALQEGLASLLRRRARTLAAGMNNLLRDPELVKKVYDHQLVKSLHLGERRPSYIPSRIFALALLDSVTPAGQPPDLASIRKVIDGATGGWPAALRMLMADADHYSQFVENVEVWFSHGMERVSGWYKRYTQGILVAIAVPFTLLLNADSLDIACVLWKDPTVRASLVAQAEQVDTSPPPPPVEPEEIADVLAQADSYVAPLRSVRLPIGWAEAGTALPAAAQNAGGCAAVRPRPASLQEWSAAFSHHWVGWFITVLAISLGSPFWFDLLNKFMAIRGGGRSPEERPKSPKEEQPALGAGERPGEARQLEAQRKS